MKALVITDVQNDFMPGGALAVNDANRIVPVINRLMSNFPLVVATQDWHPLTHKSFASNHPGKKPFDTIKLHGINQTLWPNHCVQGTQGAEFHPDLDTRPIAAIFRKGMNEEKDSYSGFYDNDHKNSTGMSGYLREKGVNTLYFCGLCSDICVYYSIQDALTLGFKCYFIEKASCALNHEDFRRIKEELLGDGVVIT